MVGDSTVLQFFLSLTALLNGTVTAWASAADKPLGRRVDRSMSLLNGRIVSFACGGATRIDFFRNDYLLYSRDDERESAAHGVFNPTRPFTDFTTSAHHTDVVILGGGMHYTKVAHFARVLNHTIASLRAARVQRTPHPHSARTIFLLPPHKPVVSCARHEAPLSMGDAVEADLAEGKFVQQYSDLHKYRELG
eukprot:6571414-Prymnesium_polylepis.1